MFAGPCPWLMVVGQDTSHLQKGVVPHPSEHSYGALTVQGCSRTIPRYQIWCVWGVGPQPTIQKKIGQHPNSWSSLVLNGLQATGHWPTVSYVNIGRETQGYRFATASLLQEATKLGPTRAMLEKGRARCVTELVTLSEESPHLKLCQFEVGNWSIQLIHSNWVPPDTAQLKGRFAVEKSTKLKIQHLWTVGLPTWCGFPTILIPDGVCSLPFACSLGGDPETKDRPVTNPSWVRSGYHEYKMVFNVRSAVFYETSPRFIVCVVLYSYMIFCNLSARDFIYGSNLM